jgi:hypothetical protein
MGEQKITLGQMRRYGVNGLLVYCGDYDAATTLRSRQILGPDEVRLSDLQLRFVCTACGTRGADIRPNFAPARMGTNAW